MVFKCVKGMFLLKKNYREAFNLEAFTEKYLEECFDKDMYIVGDISSGILRLKGFDTDPKSKNYFGFIDDYLDISCAFGCPYYVLKRVRSEEEYNKLAKDTKGPITEDDRVQIRTIEKENYDKESLVLKTTPKGKPNIVIDPRKMNAIPKGELPSDLKGLVEKEAPSRKVEVQKPEPVISQTYVSSSENFDPSKKEQRHNKPNKQNRPEKKPQNNANVNKSIEKKNDTPKQENSNTNNHNQHKNKNRNNKFKNKGNGPKPGQKDSNHGE